MDIKWEHSIFVSEKFTKNLIIDLAGSHFYRCGLTFHKFGSDKCIYKAFCEYLKSNAIVVKL